ncbi:MAG: hypothetical protein M1823_008855, partial [Watsoniomyces obsoletus]
MGPDGIQRSQSLVSASLRHCGHWGRMCCCGDLRAEFVDHWRHQQRPLYHYCSY